MSCNNCPNLMRFQTKIINRHIDEHKFFNRIDKTDDAVRDFVEKYGWLMREVFCQYICPNLEKCDVDIETLCFDSKRKNQHP